MPKIYVIHENDAWVEPLRAAFTERALPYAEWFLADGVLDLAATPPAGVFYNRMSASSHTRDHRYAAELTGGVLAWLESHGRRVSTTAERSRSRFRRSRSTERCTRTAFARRERSPPSDATT